MTLTTKSIVNLTVLAAAFVTQLSAATFPLTVNLSDSLRPVTHCASGSLYGVTETLPTDILNLVAPLKPNVFTQPALAGTGRQQPIGAAIVVSERLATTTAKVQVRLADVLPGWPYNWPGQATWLSTVTSVIKAKIASGRNNYDGYEIWNEPDGTWQTKNGDFYTVLWKPTYDLIRSLDPTARIIGPSYSYYNSTNMKAFLTFCKNNNCLPDVISWHQWGSGGFNNTFDNFRSLESSLGISPRAISINEYSSTTHEYEGSPGVSVPFIAKFERKKVESAAISWWFTALPGRLGSLLTAKNEKGGGWWLYKWYGDMTGKMVKVTPPNDNSEGVDGFASVDQTAKYASIILGGNSIGTVNVAINGIPSFFGSSVNVKLEYVTWVDKDTPVPSTTLVSTTAYNVSNGSISVPVNITNQFYAYRLYITPTKITTPPTIQITSPSQDTNAIAPATLHIVADAKDSDGSITKVDFYNGTTLLQTKATSPYTYDWSNIPKGTYTLKAIATDNDGNTSQDSVMIRVNVPQASFSGTPWTIPGIIQLENYDVGGEGVAFHDADTVNSGAVYRTDGVDITGDSTNGFMLGWTLAEEWVEYTVNVTNSGIYNWEARVSMGGDSAAFQLSLDGVNITNSVKVPSTGSWDTYTTITGSTISALSAGTHVLRITINQSYCNLDWIRFTEKTSINLRSMKVPPKPLNTSVFFDLLGRSKSQIP